MDDIQLISQALQRHLREEIIKQVKEKGDEILRDLFKEADRIALNILSHYSIDRYGQEIHITVKKEQPEIERKI